jgi:hypothetical protein
MSQSYGPKVVTDGLVYCLDAASEHSYPRSGTSWTDLVSRIDATIFNSPDFSLDGGGSFLWDATNQYVDTNREIQFDNTDPFTLMAWIKTEDANNNQIINNENVSYRGYQLAIDANNLLFLFFRNTVSTNYMGIRCDTDFLGYVAGTHDGSSSVGGLKLYINGVEQGITTVSDTLTDTTISNETTYIGYRRPNTQGPFNGKIAVAQIYNRELTANEVRQNYNSTKGRFGL